MLYQARRNATNDDLEMISAKDGGKDATNLRVSVFFAAAEWGNMNTIKAMLDRGVDIDARSPIGSTALIYATSRGRYAAAAHLLARGANVNARNDVGRTALGLAEFAKNFAQPRNYRMDEHVAVIRLLKNAGAVE